MNVFKRLSDIIEANVNSALDRMEDPEKMIDLSIRELEDAIVKMRANLREKKAETENNDDLIRELKSGIERWTERARLAAEKGEDDMAREALLEKRGLKEKLSLAEETKETLSHLLLVTEENIRDAEEKLSEMKMTSATLKARARLAKDRMEVNKAAKEKENSSYARRIEELKLKIEKWESIANISHADMKREERPSFEDLEKENEIEKELEALKKEKKDNDTKTE